MSADERLAALRRARDSVRLDDVRRARMLARLTARIDDDEAGKALATVRGRGRMWLAAAALLAAAAIALFMLRPREAALTIAVPSAPVPAPAAPEARAGASRLDVPAGATVRTELGRARVALVGPARFAVVSSTPEALTVQLDGGTLLGELDGAAAGPPLIIRSPGASTRIVGTVFAVEARDGRSRVSVRHGVVEVTSGAGVTRVASGQTYDVAAAALADLAPALNAALAEHERPARPSKPPPRVLLPPPPPAPEPAAPPPPAPVEDSPREIYTRAEAAMVRGDYEAARHGLTEVITRFPDDPLAEPAAYDLARLAFDAKDLGTARRALDGLLARGHDPALRELARYLHCRVDLAAGEPQVPACLAAFRRDYPRSPHDAEVLALLAADHLARGDCAAATPLVDEYLRRYPGGSYAATARAAAARCAR